MRKAKFTVIAGAIGALAAVSLSGPVEAGTCQPVDVKGKGKDIATATTRAQADLAVKATVLGGKGYADLDQLHAGADESRLQDLGGGLP
jgi:hypothetical protein